MLAADNSVRDMFSVIAVPSLVTAVAIALAGKFSHRRQDVAVVLDPTEPTAASSGAGR
ncbi:hypothetical protein D3C83_239600 [compost metagenome]